MRHSCSNLLYKFWFMVRDCLESLGQLTWLFSNYPWEWKRIRRRRVRKERLSNSHRSATSRHSASAGASINTHRKCFPRRPLWANQSTTPLVRPLLNVSYPSDSPAPSHLHYNWLALKSAHTLKAASFYWVIGAEWGQILFGRALWLWAWLCPDNNLHLAERCRFELIVSMFRIRIF